MGNWRTQEVHCADANKPFMGLTAFSGEMPALKDIGIAKNYLQENELKILNNLVSGYFDLAEINALEHKPMYMQAMEKAKSGYRKYQEIFKIVHIEQ